MDYKKAKTIFKKLTKNNKPTDKLNKFFLEYAKIKDDKFFLEYVLQFNIFDEKHYNYFLDSFTKRYNLLEGGYRAAKTTLNVLSFCFFLENSKEKFFLATGATTGNIGINIIECDGFGIAYYFKNKIKFTKYKGQEAYKIQTFNGEKILIVVGGEKANQFKKIKGFTLEGIIATEFNELHQNFKEMLLSRILKSPTSKIFVDFNPENDKSNFYKFINKFMLSINFNYCKLTFFENYSVSRKNKIEQIIIYQDIKSYDFKKNLLGERVPQKGIIFEYFLNNFDKLKIEKNSVQYLNLKKFIKSGKGYLRVGLDFGGNKSYHALVASYIFEDFSSLIILKSEKFLQNDDSLNKIEFDLNNFVLNFVEEITEEFREPDYLFCDSASPNHIKSVKNALYSEYETYIKNCTKLEIKERIFLFKEILRKKNIYFILENTITFQESIQNAIYDEKQNDKWLDDGTSDIDTIDAFFYSVSSNNYIQKVANFI